MPEPNETALAQNTNQDVALAKAKLSQATEQVLAMGDLSALTPEQRVEYYQALCASVGLNPLSRPFEYHSLNGKIVVYPNKGCLEQIRSMRSVTIRMAHQKIDETHCIMVAEASLPNGRTDSATAAVWLKGLSGEPYCNAIMKCETKAKRRATLSICGLGFIDDYDGTPGSATAPMCDEFGVVLEVETPERNKLSFSILKCLEEEYGIPMSEDGSDTRQKVYQAWVALKPDQEGRTVLQQSDLSENEIKVFERNLRTGKLHDIVMHAKEVVENAQQGEVIDSVGSEVIEEPVEDTAGEYDPFKEE